MVACLFVIEFQKRGLPHAHILLHLAPEDKLRTPADIDSIISAQLPDPESQPRLYAAVTKPSGLPYFAQTAMASAQACCM